MELDSLREERSLGFSTKLIKRIRIHGSLCSPGIFLHLFVFLILAYFLVLVPTKADVPRSRAEIPASH